MIHRTQEGGARHMAAGRANAWLLLLLLALPHSGAYGASLLDRARDGLSGSAAELLAGQLGISRDQAEAGIGGVLGYARERLGAADFSSLAAAIPGSDGYLGAASEAGIDAGSLGGLGDLRSALAGLGIAPETVEQFLPVLTDLVGKVGGEQARSLLATALGGG